MTTSRMPRAPPIGTDEAAIVMLEDNLLSILAGLLGLRCCSNSRCLWRRRLSSSLRRLSSICTRLSSSRWRRRSSSLRLCSWARLSSSSFFRTSAARCRSCCANIWRLCSLSNRSLSSRLRCSSRCLSISWYRWSLLPVCRLTVWHFIARTQNTCSAISRTPAIDIALWIQKQSIFSIKSNTSLLGFYVYATYIIVDLLNI